MNHAIQPGTPNAVAVLQRGYTARRNFFNLFGIKCQILAADGQPFLFVYLKAFKLKEDITVYGDQTRTQPLLSIRARQILDFSAAYDVVDHTTSQRVGALRRRGLRSLLRDEWELLDTSDQAIGTLQEDSAVMALLRRFLSNIIPQHYHLSVHGQPAATFKGTWNPFIVKHTVELSGTAPLVDPRMLLAASVLLLTVEGKQG
jgi:hypothetical protein